MMFCFRNAAFIVHFEIKSTPLSQCYIKCIYTFCNNNLCNYIIDFLGNCHQRAEGVFG